VSTLGIPAEYAATRGLAPQPEAAQLVSIGTTPDGRDIQLSPDAAKAWARMRDAASKSGIAIVVLSGFRSVVRQTALIEAKLSTGQAIEEILRTVAAPGYSEHHSGRAIDIAVPDQPTLTQAFAETAAFKWLTLNAQAFGFRMSYPKENPDGMTYEP
jgi:D-alanyl-D-alanine carboxypeptidase